MKSVIEYNDSENIESKDFRIPSARHGANNENEKQIISGKKSQNQRQRIS